MGWNRAAYREQVARVFDGRDRGTVLNGTAEHACIVTAEAFKAARSHVRLLSHKLDPICYANHEVIAAAEEFIGQPETRLDILVEDETSIFRSRFASALKEAGGDRVSVTAVPATVSAGYDFNFLSVDREAYRFESDRAYPIAIVGNDDAIATHLADLFDTIRDLSVEERPLLTA